MNEVVAVPHEGDLVSVHGLAHAAAEGIVREGHADLVGARDLAELSERVPSVAPSAAVALDALDEATRRVVGEGRPGVFSQDTARPVASVGEARVAIDVAREVHRAHPRSLSRCALGDGRVARVTLVAGGTERRVDARDKPAFIVPLIPKRVQFIGRAADAVRQRTTGAVALPLRHKASGQPALHLVAERAGRHSHRSELSRPGIEDLQRRQRPATPPHLAQEPVPVDVVPGRVPERAATRDAPPRGVVPALKGRDVGGLAHDAAPGVVRETQRRLG